MHHFSMDPYGCTPDLSAPHVDIATVLQTEQADAREDEN